MILVTGSSGLIGRAITARLQHKGHAVRLFDLADGTGDDVCDPSALAAAMEGVEGVIHLAAVSRVVWAQRDPANAWAVNVDAFGRLLDLACAAHRPPWVIFSSSREAYGEPDTLPVPETAPLKPINAYARTKVEGEAMMKRARTRGIVANIVRFSNVYGDVRDHHDRVVTAFAQSAATNGVIRLEGAENEFDFTHVADVARGLHLLVDRTIAGESFDPIHLVSGHGTTLTQLAALALAQSGGGVSPEHHAPRNYDVARFVGDPTRARDTLGWAAEISLAEGFAGLVADFRAKSAVRGEVRAFDPLTLAS
jgi:UDP-glucose 4-epimerase